MTRLTNSCAGLLLTVLASACSSDTKQIDVYAASSLTDVFGEMEEKFEAEYRNVDVRLNLAGSNTLARQITDGAEADIFAPASSKLFDNIDTANEPAIYGSNRLALAVPFDNPGQVKSLADLARPNVITARCATGVPCGDATDKLLAATNTALNKATDETNVRAVLAKLRTGEVDAGFVYSSDLAGSKEEVLEVDLPLRPEVELGLVALIDDPHANNFVEFVASEANKAVLVNNGFNTTGVETTP